MNSDQAIRVLAAREAGKVLRNHTTPHHGEYTVGTHSFNAVSMLLILHPDPSISLIKVLQWHDCAERWVGDIPAPARWADPALATAYENAEQRVLVRNGLDEGCADLTPDDWRWVRAIDMLEFYLWALDQEAMGNKNVHYQKVNALRSMQSRWMELPIPIRLFVGNFEWERLNDEQKPEMYNEI